jgi:hypothetical protein
VLPGSPAEWISGLDLKSCLHLNGMEKMNIFIYLLSNAKSVILSEF